MNRKIALALGNFDGLHLGHMKVIEKLAAFGEGFEPCALLFDEHPLEILTGKAPPLLISTEDKLSLLNKAGIRPLTVNFTKIKDLNPEEFVKDFLLSHNVGAVCCGSNYTFGKNASGNSDLLVELCKKYDILYMQADDVLYKGSLISSTRIRNALCEGSVKDAEEMLGRPYSFSLPVIQGKHLGNTLGFPTLNQRISDGYIHLRHGVYLTQSEIAGEEYCSVTNFGVRPTVDGKNLLSETYVFDFDREIYGQYVKVSFIDFLREEKKFDSLVSLKKQIEKDKKKAAGIFGR